MCSGCLGRVRAGPCCRAAATSPPPAWPRPACREFYQKTGETAVRFLSCRHSCGAALPPLEILASYSSVAPDYQYYVTVRAGGEIAATVELDRKAATASVTAGQLTRIPVQVLLCTTRIKSSFLLGIGKKKIGIWHY